MPLKNEWIIDANGFSGTLIITDPAGNPVTGSTNVIGTISLHPDPVQDIEGFSSEPAKRLTFIRVMDKNVPNKNQIYTGYWFARDHTKPAAGSDLAGSFYAFVGTGGSPERNVFGWHEGMA